MNKKTVIGIVISLVLVALIVWLLIPKKNADENVDYVYKITFYDELEPGNRYEFEISKDYDIKVTETNFCTAADCKESTEKYLVDFSPESRTVLKDNLSLYFENDNEIELRFHETKESTLIVIESIITKDEKLLKELENIDNEYLYMIISNRLNCPTVTLTLYSDNTYKYYYTYENEDGESGYIEGIYNYDVNKLINNISNYEDNGNGPYIITGPTNKYVTYDNNTELKELLNSINIDLDVCLKD